MIQYRYTYDMINNNTVQEVYQEEYEEVLNNTPSEGIVVEMEVTGANMNEFMGMVLAQLMALPECQGEAAAAPGATAGTSTRRNSKSGPLIIEEECDMDQGSDEEGDDNDKNDGDNNKDEN